jgi:hypothetical protein
VFPIAGLEDIRDLDNLMLGDAVPALLVNEFEMKPFDMIRLLKKIEKNTENGKQGNNRGGMGHPYGYLF